MSRRRQSPEDAAEAEGRRDGEYFVSQRGRLGVTPVVMTPAAEQILRQCVRLMKRLERLRATAQGVKPDAIHSGRGAPGLPRFKASHWLSYLRGFIDVAA